ncbi:MAG: site-specific integrase [Streptococcaceae bacterium]|nr:site-specific integrase [Streptococcaceae bacterium]
MKYEKTKYPNIYSYETKSGKKYAVRRGYFFEGKKKEFNKSGLKTIGEAKSILANSEINIQNNEINLINSSNITVGQYWDIFSEKRITIGKWTRDSERGNVSIYKVHIKPKFENIKLKDLSRNEYELFINERLTKYSRETVRAMNALFMSLINDAVLNGNVERNKLRSVYIGKSSIKKRNKKLTLDQFNEWISTAEKKLSPFEFVFVYLTIFGMRRGEVVGLRSKDIQFNNGRAVIHIQETRTQSELYGKGSTKTESSNRFITLDEKGSKLIAFALLEAKKIKADFNKILNQNDFLFLNSVNGKVYHPSQLNRLFNAVNDELPYIKASPHMMRHFFATQSIIAGVNIEMVGDYLGHTQKYMTEQYSHIENEVSEKVVNIFESSLKKSPTSKKA